MLGHLVDAVCVTLSVCGVYKLSANNAAGSTKAPSCHTAVHSGILVS